MLPKEFDECLIGSLPPGWRKETLYDYPLVELAVDIEVHGVSLKAGEWVRLLTSDATDNQVVLAVKESMVFGWTSLKNLKPFMLIMPPRGAYC